VMSFRQSGEPRPLKNPRSRSTYGGAVNKKVAAFTLIVGIAILFFALGGYSWVTTEGNVEELLTETGVLGPIIFVLIMWLTQPLGVPGFVYMIPAGIVWPYPMAIALSWIGNLGASFIAFSFARWFGRDWVKARIPPRMHQYDDQLEQGGLRPVILLRLVFGQLPPADWLLGVTKVSQRNFLIGTGIGIIPGVILFVVAGGGFVELLLDMPALARRIIIGIIVALVIGMRVWKRRTRKRRDGALAEPIAENSSDQLE
jgi:uncharacterized membrane protein YdjX (TVP38/TMEM64 family)